MIHISVNNQPHTLAANTLLGDAIAAWGYGDSKIAIAINGDFVPRSSYSARTLQAGDNVDIVKPVGGG